MGRLDVYRVARYIRDAHALDRLEPTVRDRIDAKFGAGKSAIVDLLVKEGLVIAEKTSIIGNGSVRENTAYSITNKGRRAMSTAAKRKTIVEIVADEPASYEELKSIFGHCDGDMYWLLHKNYMKPTVVDGIRLPGKSFVATEKGKAALNNGLKSFEGQL